LIFFYQISLSFSLYFSLCFSLTLHLDLQVYYSRGSKNKKKYENQSIKKQKTQKTNYNVKLYYIVLNFYVDSE